MFMVNVAWSRTTHTRTDTLCVSQAMAPVSQMAVRINLKLSSATTTPPLSVCPAFRHNSSGNGRLGSTAHFHISVFLFIIFSPSFSSLTLSFELRILGL